MGSFRIATRYSKSILQLAETTSQLDAVFTDIKALNQLFETTPELKSLFKSPIITSDKKLTIVKQLFEGKINTLLYQFVVLMIKKGRESYLNEITQAFITQYNALKHITPVRLITAVKLESGVVQTMVTALKAKELLKEIELHEEVDQELLGGFILKYGDKMIDHSVKRRLQELNNLIEDNTYIKKYS